MAVTSKPRVMLEGLVREGSFKWLIGSRAPFGEEFEEMGKSPSARKNWINELSPIANLVVRRCSKILSVSTVELQDSFKKEASDSLKHPSEYARNFLEYCCFRTLALSIQEAGHLSDKKFRRLTYDMMVAWEIPAAIEPSVNADEDISVGVDAFSRIAPAIPIIADVIISENLFEVLAASTEGRLYYVVYDKYLTGLEREIRKCKSQSESSLISSFRSRKGEKILEVDGTVTTQPVLEHVGMSAWPGRLILTDHAIYFEALRVVSYDNAKRYDLSDDLKQLVKPELTGPWGARLFDKAILYKSISLSEPVIFEFPELKGHTRRDYWLAIVQEILYVHKFIRKYQITGVERDDVLSRAVLGILRLQAIQEIYSSAPVRCEDMLMFNLCDQLPGGDLILEALAKMSSLRERDRTNNYDGGGTGMYSVSSLAMISNLGFLVGSPSSSNETGLLVGEIAVGQMNPLERAVKESKSSYKNTVVAQATVDGVKVDGIDTNIAVMKELLLPLAEVGNWLLSLAYWDEPLHSLIFCLVVAYTISRGLLRYATTLVLVFMAIFMVLTRYFNNEKTAYEVKVIAPPPMNTMEQLLAVQNAISQAEGFVQDGNIVLLKLRGLLMAIYPQASEKFAAVLLAAALVVAFVPERWMRRLREWWFSIPAAPVVLQREREDKKKK
ncbi:hypothetical protein MLD38_012475 [Melastoma candidum]|uniref:Uncharacterized protein n=1 Tax=Melastoma candidum TaxID=119954 RepID=A0ACB9R6I4_9MYRT|nr:hypothetical protein MLD38_012475 [Melastoma candidum]